MMHLFILTSLWYVIFRAGQQAKFKHSPLGKAFQEQARTIKERGDKQIEAIENQEGKQLSPLRDVDFMLIKKDKLLFFLKKKILDKKLISL